ncbi:hypothetical protein [Methylobacter sp. YRD-M1]|uniref:hypothetical protein n=1 Tax=Methylobacter sp. YRD-M1 TaxID=2911520 RepID=UPI00227C5B6A|nr:hypothetical protein [Methylobacter sp. YRD-M1]WAK02670.1 hypothetical protein LZ558_02440 [Methylobacter sp. YRD-M1]
MKHFNKQILTAGILLILGSISSAWAEPALFEVKAQMPTAGDGSASAIDGDATSNYKVNNSTLAGAVTGTIATPVAALASVTPNNSITNSFNSTAGINQSVQNLGDNALVQQQISVQGNVNTN